MTADTLPQPIEGLLEVLDMIKVQHTIFALPFALQGAILARWNTAGPFDDFTITKLAIIVLACLFARSAAMAFNRLVDQEIDAKNPRTAMRSLPAGRLSRGFVAVFVVLNVAGFVASAAMLNQTALVLSPVALVVLLGYSYTKRFTPLCHFVLGLALGIAPCGAWIAVAGRLDWPPVLLGIGVMLWTAGFDILYSCQDVDVDRADPRLHSIPKSFGVARAMMLARLVHIAAWCFFVIAAWNMQPLGIAYTIGLALAALLLIRQHSIVSPADLSRINAAFFTANGALSILLLAAIAVDIMLLVKMD